VTINTKALAQVHRSVAGTDYDFEDEFGDDFGEPEKAEPVSLKELREQSKKQNLPVYMQQEAKSQHGKKGAFGDFDDDDFDDFAPVVKRGGGARGRGGRGRGRGRGRPAKTTPLSQPSPQFFPDADLQNHPKLPKLKLGALLIRKESRESLRSAGPEEAKVPKLKIKLGPKPAESPASKLLHDHRKDAEAEEAAMPAAHTSVDDDLDPEDKGLVIAEDDGEPAQKSNTMSGLADIDDDDDVFRRVGDVLRVDDDDEARVSPSGDHLSPSKRGGKLDNLASKLLGAKQVKPTELDSIFGPSVPLDIATPAAAAANSLAASQAASHPSPFAGAERQDTRPSSLSSVQVTLSFFNLLRPMPLSFSTHKQCILSHFIHNSTTLNKNLIPWRVGVLVTILSISRFWIKNILTHSYYWIFGHFFSRTFLKKLILSCRLNYSFSVMALKSCKKPNL
jgi:hypothetical protein